MREFAVDDQAPRRTRNVLARREIAHEPVDVGKCGSEFLAAGRVREPGWLRLQALCPGGEAGSLPAVASQRDDQGQEQAR